MRNVAVGDTLSPLTTGRVSRTTLALFAGSSGDLNPIHVDIDMARSAGLDDVFAHGMLGMAYLARLLTDLVPQAHIRSFEVRFASITPVNAEPTCSGTVTDVADGTITVDLQVALADGTVTLAGTATIDAIAFEENVIYNAPSTEGGEQS